MWYGLDLSPIVEEHGLGEYIFEFKIKVSKNGPIQFYTQNGTKSEYWIGYNKIDATTEYKKISKKVTITSNNNTETMSQVAFYGTYYSGVYPTVKDMRLYKVSER